MSRTTHRAARLVARVLLTAGLLALGYAAYVVIDTTAYQAIEQKRFERARQDAAATPALVDGVSIGEIQIPRLGLAGHRDTFFRPLKRVRTGDAITLKTRNGDFEYLVESTAVVRPSDLQVIQPTNRRTLTLITCFPFSYVGPAPDRFIVRAREVKTPR